MRRRAERTRCACAGGRSSRSDCWSSSSPPLGTAWGRRCGKLHVCDSTRMESKLAPGTVQTTSERTGSAREPRPTSGRRLSYSSISLYERCPQAFKFQYEDRLPTSSSPALAFGDSLHRALHRFHDRPVPVPPSLDELQEMLVGEWISDGYRDPGEEQLYL